MKRTEKTQPSKQAPVLSLPEVYDRWRIAIRIGKILGGLPTNPEARARFVEQAAVNAPEPEAAADELGAKLDSELPTDDLADVGFSTFKANGVGPYIESRQIKACFKIAATILKYTNSPTTTTEEVEIDGKKKKVKTSEGGPGRQFFQHAFFVEPDMIPLGKAVAGTERMYGHVMTAQGPRSIVRNADFVEDVELTFTVKALAGKLSETKLMTMLSLMQDNGLGACRSQGFGKFQVLSVERI